MTYKDVLGEAVSVSKVSIRLTYKQWAHIIESHDYMAGNIDKVLETVGDPDYIVKGRTGELIAVRHYTRTNITEKFCIVVYKEYRDSGFVITSFFTSRPQTIKRGGIVWEK